MQNCFQSLENVIGWVSIEQNLKNDPLCRILLWCPVSLLGSLVRVLKEIPCNSGEHPTAWFLISLSLHHGTAMQILWRTQASLLPPYLGRLSVWLYTLVILFLPTAYKPFHFPPWHLSSVAALPSVLSLSTNPWAAFFLPHNLAFNLKYNCIASFVSTVSILTLQRGYKVSKGQNLEMTWETKRSSIL